MKTKSRLTLVLLFLLTSRAAGADLPGPMIDLHESLVPSPVHEAARGSIVIRGGAVNCEGRSIRLRVTTSRGETFESSAPVKSGRFACRFPQEFRDAPALSPMLLYVDATDANEFGDPDLLQHQAEALLIVSGPTAAPPDLPLTFTDDFLDSQGGRDTGAAQWPRQRALVNLFMHSRGARLMGIHRPAFDLEKPSDFGWFKDHASLYDFDHRDRDWSQPLGHRVARGFWQAVWNTWFNSSNDHPWDGNATNRKQENFHPYTFANDTADILVLYQMLRAAIPKAADNRAALVNENLENLLAMQYQGASNFAIKEKSGKQEHYTKAAFRYGLFETGEWLTEGTGWFSNPQFRDFARGGVFNGRAVWALGESLKADPQGLLSARIRETVQLGLRFCLNDGLAHQYSRLSKSGLPLWGGPDGEHAYLLLGMLAASEAAPDLAVRLNDEKPARPLHELCVDALDALAEVTGVDGTWSRYANANAINIAALAEGARVLAGHKHAILWTSTAVRAADVWLSLKPRSSERTQPTPMFGSRSAAGDMTFVSGRNGKAQVSLYIGGHWLHALSCLASVTHEARYAERAGAILAYYCGDNPLRARLLNELGSVNNHVADSDGDGIEDTLHWDAYPESTAFVQIGLLHFLTH